MATIHALPATTVHALGSGQVLTDPVALVKELIENSLDAGATQITIEASANLLDSLVVKDNGFGISPPDRALACKRHFTSKITSFDDIASVSTLGFRGEALASAAELSESLSLTTRVEGEPVAEVYDIARDGEVKERRSIGAPVGTTVKVAGFLKRLPVRRESAIRMQKALVKRLKELVARYYLSKPSCRFALKILTPKGDMLVYAPSKTIPEAARKVAGKDAAAACEWTTKERNGFTVEAFLAKKDCDLSIFDKPGFTGQYVYVDSRPVSCAKGTLTKAWKLYKSHIKAIATNKTPPDKAPSNPLLYLHIQCPKGSYDSNIEPAKDDVLFGTSDAEAAVEELFTEIYGDLPGGNYAQKSKDKEKTGSEAADFEILLARKRDSIEDGLPPPPTPPEEEPDDIGLPPPPKIPETIAPDSMDEAATDAEKEEIRKNPTLSNPWTFAKMNTLSSPARRRPALDLDAATSSPAGGSSSPARPVHSPTTHSSPVRSSPSNPPAHSSTFTPINTLRPRLDGGNSSSPVVSPASKPQRRGYGIPPTPPTFSSPQFTERRYPQRFQNEPTLLTDPENAGAMDRFIVRTPRTPAQNQRPIPRHGFGGEDEDAELAPGPRRREDPPIPDSNRVISNDNESPPSQEPRSQASNQRFRPPRRIINEDDDFFPRVRRPREKRPRGDFPSGGDFISAAAVYDEVGSQQVDGDGRLHPTPKRRREDDQDEPRKRQNPNKNRFLAATAALAPFTGDVYGEVPVTSPQREMPENETEAHPEDGTEDHRPTTSSHAHRLTTRTLPAPPLFHDDEEFKTHRLTARIPISLDQIKCLSANRADLLYRSEGNCAFAFDGFQEEEIGAVVKRWIEEFTGVEESAVTGWELGPGEEVLDALGEVEEGVSVLKALVE
jgi:DNA mismatch repair protein MutL